jgi:hypothetical protein
MQGKGRGNNFTKDNSLKCGHSVAFPDLKNWSKEYILFWIEVTWIYKFFQSHWVEKFRTQGLTW